MTTIRSSFAIAALASLASLLPSSVRASGPVGIDTLWTANGLRVCPVATGQTHPVLTADGHGGVIISWEDGRLPPDHFRSIFAARLTPSGAHVPGWPDTGLAVEGTGYGEDQAIAADGSGGAFLTWAIGYGNVTMQHVLANGAMATAPPQVTATPDHAELAELAKAVSIDAVQKRDPRSYAPVLLPDGGGGTYVAWEVIGFTYDWIQLQDVTGSGFAAPGWPFPVTVSNTTASAYGPTMCSDGVGGVYAAWEVYAIADSGFRIEVVHYSTDGKIAANWPIAPVVPCAGGGPQFAPGLVPDGAGGAIAFWNDDRSTPHSQLYAMRLLPDGTPAPGWPTDGLPVCAYASQPSAARADGGMTYQSVVPDGGGGAFIAWSDSRSDTGDICVQHILPDGTHPAGWPENGVPVCMATGLQSLPALTPDGADGIIVVWQDERSIGAPHIYAQRIIGDGTVAPGWPLSGLAICTAAGRQSRPVIASDGALGAFIAWEDTRSGVSAIYAAHVTGDAIVPVEVSLLSSEVGPGFVRLTWDATVARDGNLTLERRTQSSGWMNLATLVSDASGRVTFEDRQVMPGALLGYRLSYTRSGIQSSTPETWVDVPLGAPMALESPRPNPVVGSMSVSLTLANGEPAVLSILDVSGRKVVEREVGGLGAGHHELPLAIGPHAPPGLYWLQLYQGDRILRTRFAVLR